MSSSSDIDSESSSSSSMDEEEKEKSESSEITDDDNTSSSSESSESEVSDDFDQGMFALDDNIVTEAARDTARRLARSHIQMTPSGTYAAVRTTQDIAQQRDKKPWEIVNPMGVHPHDDTKPIFSYDLSQLPNTVEAKPWTAPDADITQWFNYGFTETTWEKYRKKILKVIENKNLETKVKTLTGQTKV